MLRNDLIFNASKTLIFIVVHIVEAVTKSFHGSLNEVNINVLIFENRYTICNGSVTKNVTIVTILSIDYQIIKLYVKRFCNGKYTFVNIEYQSNTYYNSLLNRNKNEKTLFQP